jgi:hypothetical protein
MMSPIVLFPKPCCHLDYNVFRIMFIVRDRRLVKVSGLSVLGLSVLGHFVLGLFVLGLSVFITAQLPCNWFRAQNAIGP